MMQPQTMVNPNWETQSYSPGTDSASFFDSASSACSSSGESAASRGGLATNLHTLGVADKDIQAILRHSNIGLTMNVYVKSVNESQVNALDALQEKFATCSNLAANQRFSDSTSRLSQKAGQVRVDLHPLI